MKKSFWVYTTFFFLATLNSGIAIAIEKPQKYDEISAISTVQKRLAVKAGVEIQIKRVQSILSKPKKIANLSQQNTEKKPSEPVNSK